MTASSARPGQQTARSAPQSTTSNSATHVPPSNPLDIRVDALGVQMLMADRFMLNIILE